MHVGGQLSLWSSIGASSPPPDGSPPRPSWQHSASSTPTRSGRQGSKAASAGGRRRSSRSPTQPAPSSSFSATGTPRKGPPDSARPQPTRLTSLISSALCDRPLLLHSVINRRLLHSVINRHLLHSVINHRPSLGILSAAENPRISPLFLLFVFIFAVAVAFAFEVAFALAVAVPVAVVFPAPVAPPGFAIVSGNCPIIFLRFWPKNRMSSPKIT